MLEELVNDTNECRLLFKEKGGEVIFKDVSDTQVSQTVEALCTLAETVVECIGEDNSLPIEMWIADPNAKYEYFSTIHFSGIAIAGQEVIVDPSEWGAALPTY